MKNNLHIIKFLRNIKNVKAIYYKNANTLDILNGGMLIIDADVFEEKVSMKDKKEATQRARKSSEESEKKLKKGAKN